MTSPPQRAAGRRADPHAVLAKAVLAAAGRLGLRNRQLAAVIGSSEASVSRLQSGRGLDPERKEGELALLFLRLYRWLDALVGGDDEKARQWLHADNDHLARSSRRADPDRGGARRCRPVSGRDARATLRFARCGVSPWRAVEAQHQVSTRKLVDSVEEQVLLEELIDRAKPPRHHRGRAALPALHAIPISAASPRLALRHAARARNLVRIARSRRTAFAEVAYYRLLFLEGTTADLGVVTTQLTAFTATCARSAVWISLSPPFDVHRRAIASRTCYASTQALGAAMRDAGVELFRYPSARDAEGGVNVAAFTPAVFGAAEPHAFETWHCMATRERVELTKRDYFRRDAFAFERASFLVSGRLPSPAI